jgi:uncharacterized protein (TIGR02266 family)
VNHEREDVAAQTRSQAAMNERERRLHPRFPLILAVEYPDSPSRIQHYTENLSAEGLLIRTDRHFTPGDRVALLVSFPNVPDPVEMQVEVRWTHAAEGDEPAGVGVWVPLDRQEDRARLEELTRAAVTAAEGRQASHRILLVEDNSLVVAMYASALRRLFASDGLATLAVEVARDGHEAFARLLATPPIDLVITDIYMPVMSGFLLVEKIRSEERLRSLPIVVISSGAAEDHARLLKLGVNVLLQKPVKYQDILGAVRPLLAAGAQPGAPALLAEEPGAAEQADDRVGASAARPLDTSRGKAQRSS